MMPKGKKVRLSVVHSKRAETPPLTQRERNALACRVRLTPEQIAKARADEDMAVV